MGSRGRLHAVGRPRMFTEDAERAAESEAIEV